jgi:hypothetical protein
MQGKILFTIVGAVRHVLGTSDSWTIITADDFSDIITKDWYFFGPKTLCE